MSSATASPRKHWLQVRIIGTRVNCMGIDCLVNVYASGKMGEPEALLGCGEVGTGYGFCSTKEAVVHFGLGDANQCDVEAVLPFGRGFIRRKNVIRGNGSVMGGGVDCEVGVIVGNTITGNVASMGGGVASAGTVANNIIIGNSAAERGGGVYAGRHAVVANNTVVANSSPQ